MNHSFDKDYWDQIWTGERAGSMGTSEANAHLIQEVGGLAPGSAIDAGCGAGAEAIWLATQGWTVTAADVAEALDLPPQGGLLVQGIERGSAAETAGLRGPRQFVIIGNYEIGVGGDLIMYIDGAPVDRSDAISRAMAKKRPGDKLDLQIFRAGRTQRLSVTLDEDPADTL